MNKADIVRKIHETAGIEEDQAASLFEQVLKLLKSTLKSGEPINYAKGQAYAKTERACGECKVRTWDSILPLY